MELQVVLPSALQSFPESEHSLEGLLAEFLVALEVVLALKNSQKLFLMSLNTILRLEKSLVANAGEDTSTENTCARTMDIVMNAWQIKLNSLL